jgi:hypothetical protein
MSKLMDLVREQRRRRAGINDNVMIFHWAGFNKERPSQAMGLQQEVDESHEQFIGRVEAAACAKGLRTAFISNIRNADFN